MSETKPVKGAQMTAKVLRGVRIALCFLHPVTESCRVTWSLGQSQGLQILVLSWHLGPAAPWGTMKDKMNKRSRLKPPIPQDPLRGWAVGGSFPPFPSFNISAFCPPNMCFMLVFKH